jgi:hypothetical protein
MRLMEETDPRVLPIGFIIPGMDRAETIIHAYAPYPLHDCCLPGINDFLRHCSWITICRMAKTMPISQYVDLPYEFNLARIFGAAFGPRVLH